MNRKIMLWVLWVSSIVAFILLMSLKYSISSYQIGALLVIVCAVLTFIIYYADFSSFTKTNYLSILIGYCLVFCTIYYYSIDLGYSFHLENTNDLEQIKKHQEYYGVFWSILYWSILIQNNLIFQLSCHFQYNGYLGYMKKLKQSILMILTKIVIVTVMAVVFVLVCIYGFKIKSTDSIKGILITMSNVYGITVLVFMLGFGLVQMPIHIYRSTQDQNRLDIMISKLYTRQQNLFNFKKQMNSNMDDIMQIQDQIQNYPQFQNYYEAITQQLNKANSQTRDRKHSLHQKYKFLNTTEVDITSNTGKNSKLQKKKVTEKLIAQKRYKFDLSCQKYYIEQYQYNQMLFEISQKIQNFEGHFKEGSDLLKNDNLSTHLLNYECPFVAKKQNLLVRILKMIAAFVLGLFSLFIMYQESVLVIEKPKILGLYYLKQISEDVLVNQIMILTIIVYMIACAYFTLFKINIYDSLILIKGHATSVCLLQNCMMAMALVNPICYNLLLLFDASDEGEYQSAFAQFYKPMQNIPFFGERYNQIVPLIIVIIAMISLFRPSLLVSKLTRGRLLLEEEDYQKQTQDLQQGVNIIIEEKNKEKYYQQRQLEQQKEIEEQRAQEIMEQQIIINKEKQKQQEKAKREEEQRKMQQQERIRKNKNLMKKIAQSERVAKSQQNQSEEQYIDRQNINVDKSVASEYVGSKYQSYRIIDGYIQGKLEMEVKGKMVEVELQSDENQIVLIQKKKKAKQLIKYQNIFRLNIDAERSSNDVSYFSINTREGIYQLKADCMEWAYNLEDQIRSNI